MKDFEKFLRDLPKPAVDVPVYRRELRRDLAAAAVRRRGSLAHLAHATSWAVAAAFAALLVLFVARPAIPAGLHATLVGGEPAEIAGSAVVLPERGASSVAADRAFVDDWTSRQAIPAGVRSMEAEQVYTVRQFSLSDGRRVLVFSELAPDPAPRQPLVAQAAKQVF